MPIGRLLRRFIGRPISVLKMINSQATFQDTRCTAIVLRENLPPVASDVPRSAVLHQTLGVEEILTLFSGTHLICRGAHLVSNGILDRYCRRIEK